MASDVFHAERFLSVRPPYYDKEWEELTYNLIILTILFIVILPVIAKLSYGTSTTPSSVPIQDESLSRYNESSSGRDRREKKTSTTKNGKKDGNARKKKTENNARVAQNPTTPRNKDDEQGEKEDNTDNTPAYLYPLFNFVFIISLFGIIGSSSDNTYAARRVFVAPMLYPDECQQIIDMANAAAQRNADHAHLRLLNTTTSEIDKKASGLTLKSPKGWKKGRHSSYPTTDLNVADDFEDVDLAYLKQLLNARLSPLVERIYGVPRDSIRAYDMFIVRYDGDGQQSLKKHTDSSHISFNVLLNDGFVGGGTRYHNRVEDTFVDVNPKSGQILIHSARIHHEGLPTTSGTRYIFVGFMSIDRKNPLTGKPSKLKWRSSWFSFLWLTVTIGEALSKKASQAEGGARRSVARRSVATLSNNKYINGFLVKLFYLFQVIADIRSPHDVAMLVNETDSDEYIQALNTGYEENGKNMETSNWFDGQLIESGFDGLSLDT